MKAQSYNQETNNLNLIKEKKLAVLMMLMSSLSFALMGVLVKMVPDVPSTEKALFRTVTVMVISFIILRQNYPDKFPKIHNLKWLLMRSTFGTIGIVLNYYAVSHLLLADASIIFRLSSILVLIFSFLFLKEKLGKEHIIPILIAFAGILLIVRPTFNSKLFDYIVALGGVVSASLAYVALRKLGKNESSHMVVFFFSCFSTVALIPFAFFNAVSLDLIQGIYLSAAGIFAAIGQYGITIAYKHAPAKEVSIYNYAGVVFSGILGFLFFDALPDFISIVGYFIIFGASYALYKNTISNNSSK